MAAEEKIRRRRKLRRDAKTPRKQKADSAGLEPQATKLDASEIADTARAIEKEGGVVIGQYKRPARRHAPRVRDFADHEDRAHAVPTRSLRRASQAPRRGDSKDGTLFGSRHRHHRARRKQAVFGRRTDVTASKRCGGSARNQSRRSSFPRVRSRGKSSRSTPRRRTTSKSGRSKSFASTAGCSKKTVRARSPRSRFISKTHRS